MKLGLFLIILCIFTIIIAYITYNIYEYMGNSLEIREINSYKKKCHTINIPTTLSHLIPINDIYLIASEFKSLEFYNFKDYLNGFAAQKKEDNLYLFNIKKQKYEKAKIMDFPGNIPFHPDGLSLYKKSENSYVLYVINHAVNLIYIGKERVEKINLEYNPYNEEVTLFYDSGIILGDEYFLRVDSISVIEPDVFYFTTNKPFPSPGDEEVLINYKKIIHFFFYNFLETLFTMLNIKKCNTYLYYNNVVTKVLQSGSLLNKGIAYDKKRKLLYIIKSMEKELNVFEVHYDNDYYTKLIKKIPILYVGNNIYYDENKDLIYIGINGKMNEYYAIIDSYKKNNNFDKVDVYSGYEIIDPKNNYSINELMIMKNDYKWVSSAIETNDNIYMSSIFTNGIYTCEK